MKPIGSITNTLPFIESEERKLVQSIIEEARNYADFAKRLCNHVLSIEPSEAMVYFALHHVMVASSTDQSKLFDKFADLSCIRPTFMWWNMTITNTWDWDALQKEVEDAITSITNPWILFNLYTLRYDCIRGTSVGSLEEDKNIQKMTELIKQNKSLEYARSRIYSLIANQYVIDGNIQRAIEEDETAIQHALIYDDIAYAAAERIGLAKNLAHIDPSKGLKVIESAAKTIRELGYMERKTALFTIMGLLFDARGEYDAAVRSLEEGLELRERIHPGLSPRYFPAALSRAFRRMGLAEEALEWAKIGLSAKPILSYAPSIGLKVTGNLYASIALALLGRIEEAKEYYDIGSKLVLKSGLDLWLSDMYLCRGLIERAEGKITDALTSFEDALDIVERLQRQGRINECLFLLSETEILYQYEVAREGEGILAFHWIGVMEEMARKMNLPGILGLSLLLTARVQYLEGNNEAALATIGQVREISKNPATRFLQDRIEILSSTYNPERRR